MGEIARAGAPSELGAGSHRDQGEQPPLRTGDLGVGAVELLDQRVNVEVEDGVEVDVEVDGRTGGVVGEGFAVRSEHAIDATGEPDRRL